MGRLKQDKNGNIDFGKYVVPTSWSDITLNQLCAMNRKQTEREKDGKYNIFDNIEILTGKKRKEVEELPYEFIDSIMAHMAFLNTPLPEYEPRPYIVINGERYVANLQEKMTVGEYAAIDTILRSDPDDLASILAVLFRKEGEKYDEDYELNLFERRKSMFGNSPVTDVMPAVSFFLRLFTAQEISSQLYSQSVQQLDSIAESIRNYRNSSDSPNISWMRRKAILRRLKRLKKEILINSCSG